MGLTWKDELVGPLLTWQTIHCLQKEWAGGFSVCWASARVSWEGSAGLAARMCTDWGSRHGGSGHQTRKRKRRSFTPRPTLALVTALLWPPAWPWRPLEVLVFRQDLRFLWLPKDTKFERQTLHGAPGRQGQCLDYTQLLATMWRVFSIDNNEICKVSAKYHKGPSPRVWDNPYVSYQKGEQK